MRGEERREEWERKGREEERRWIEEGGGIDMEGRKESGRGKRKEIRREDGILEGMRSGAERRRKER